MTAVMWLCIQKSCEIIKRSLENKICILGNQSKSFVLVSRLWWEYFCWANAFLCIYGTLIYHRLNWCGFKHWLVTNASWKRLHFYSIQINLFWSKIQTQKTTQPPTLLCQHDRFCNLEYARYMSFIVCTFCCIHHLTICEFWLAK